MDRNVFAEHTVRIDQMIWLPAAIWDDSAPRAFQEFAEDYPTEATDPLFEHLPERIKELASHEDLGNDAVQFAFLELPGFLFKVETPVMRKSGNQWHYSWGYTTYAWLYADHLDQVRDRTVAWAEKMQAEDKEKANAA